MNNRAAALTVVLVCTALTACGGAGSGADGWKPLGPEGGIVFSLTLDPNDPETVYAGASGSLFRSTDGATHWSSAAAELGATAWTVVIDPSKPERLFAGTEEGVIRSDDGGDSWQPANTGIEKNSVHAIAFDPEQPDTLYAGTNTGFLDLFGQARGIFKSTDAGETWQQVNQGLPLSHGGLGFEDAYPLIEALVVDPRSPETVYAGTSDSVFKSENGGKSWMPAGKGLVGDAAVNALALDTRSGNLYAGTESGVFRSSDGARTWSRRGDFGHVSFLAIDPKSPHTLYAASRSVFESRNDGASWEKKVLGKALGQGAVDRLGVLALAIDPNEPRTIYAATANGVLKTADGGASWQAVNSGLTGVAVQLLAVDPDSSDSVYVSSLFGGVGRSADGGTSWQDAGKGMGVELLNALVFDPTRPHALYAGGEAGLFKSDHPGATWRPLGQPYQLEGVTALALDPELPQTLYLAAEGLFSTTDGGATWNRLGDGPDEIYSITAFAVAGDPPVFYVGDEENGIYKSVDEGKTWQKARRGLPCTGDQYLAECAAILALAVDPESQETLYAGTAKGVFKTTDGGRTWRSANEGLSPSRRVVSLLVDPTESQTVYVSTPGGVFESDDGAGSWHALDGLPSDGALLATDAEGATLYAGTANGVFSR